MSASQLIQLLQGSVSESTLKKRVPMLLSVGKALESNDLSWITDTVAIKKLLMQKPVGTRCNYIRTILGLANALKINKSVIDTYERWATEWDTERISARMNNESTPRHDSYLSIGLNGLRERLAEYKPDTLADLQQATIIACYLLMPALRNDFGQLIIANKLSGLSNDLNYIYIRGNQMRIILNKYKTAPQYGKQDIKITDKDLIARLKDWIKQSREFAISKGQANPEYLFYYRFNKQTGLAHLSPISLQTAIPDMAEKIIGVRMSINGFRTLWETTFQLDPTYQRMTNAEQQAIHKSMLHSANAARLDYKKV